ncbi:hypothetical protein H6P81_004531 [Aristolochia fimbriata]|uniref:Uncharacterized protein n=1 Tax=Aristolochia fimbriata TaxID=158543 RepID=A0AAV7FI28_ARIFI|nr:hypothetical protein H6P81_004531 [Aristolochia fimbriata]
MSTGGTYIGNDDNSHHEFLEVQGTESAPSSCTDPFINICSSSPIRNQDGKTSRKKFSKKSSLDEEDFVNLLHGSDPVKMELNRLHNEVKDKDRELQETHNEVKALRLSERAKDKALAEVREDLERMIDKFQASEAALENKNLEIKRISEEKKAALAAQFAAEATVRRVHAAQKDEELPSLEAILAPLDAEIKLLRLEISKVQEDKRTLERLTKSKEAALVEAEKEVEVAKAKASIVDDLQNRNQDLMKQVEISQEEYRILDKMHRQKVAEVEKLGQTVGELQESLLSGAAAAANAVRDYQRQVHELKGEKKTLERTLSRAKVTENRVATVIANEWKEPGDKVMPVKQWLEERRILMSEMQQLRDKLAITDRAAKTEAQLKEKLQMRLKVVEEGLKSSVRSTSGFRTLDRRNSFNGINSRRQSSQPSTAPNIISPIKPSPKQRSSSCDDRKSAGTPPPPPPPPRLVRSHTFSGRSPSSAAVNLQRSYSTERESSSISLSKSLEEAENTNIPGGVAVAVVPRGRHGGDEYCDGGEESVVVRLMYKDDSILMEEEQKAPTPDCEMINNNICDYEEVVPGVLYDLLQKEVISLRKLCHERDHTLREKEKAIEMLSGKVKTLRRAMEVESKKMRREKAVMEKEVASMRIGGKQRHHQMQEDKPK